MGFMDGKFATNALLSIKGPITAKSYNLAVRNLKNIKTDMLCKPWYVGNALPYHIPNNTDITVDYKNGKVVVRTRLHDIAPVDKELAQTRDLGEEVQPEHEARQITNENDDQGDPGGRRMTSILAFSIFGVDWQLLKPFIVIGLAFGGVYALSGRRPGRAVPGDRRAEPRVRRDRRGRRPDRLLHRHAHGLAALAGLHDLRARSAGSSTSPTAWSSAPPSRAAIRSSR